MSAPPNADEGKPCTSCNGTGAIQIQHPHGSRDGIFDLDAMLTIECTRCMGSKKEPRESRRG